MKKEVTMYVLKSAQEQNALMTFVNALPDNHKDLVVKFGGEMYCQGYMDGITDYKKGLNKGFLIGSAVAIAIGLGYSILELRKESKEEQEETE